MTRDPGSRTPTATLATEASDGGSAPPECRLVVVEGPEMGRALELGGHPVEIGTDPAAGLPLTDPHVSWRHARITPHEGRFLVSDLGSTNGTRYEGARVGEVLVPLGATLKIGETWVRLQPRPRPIEVAPSQARRCGELVGESLVMREVFAVLELAAESDATVLLEGETGTGKELAARAVHEASARRRGPFVALDCGALPESLVESALFGHLRGAFTGAVQRRDGAFVRADGGTLFLDELGDVGLDVQARLVRAIEERRVRPVGGDGERAVDVRLVAASRHDLAERVAAGSFRPDLFYRLSVIRVPLPALARRREDIAPITAELLRRRGFEPGPVSGANLERLLAHDWPGNVRELRNVLDRALALSPGASGFQALRVWTERGGGGGAEALTVRTDLPWAEAKAALLEVFERRYLTDLMGRVDGNISAAAREAGVDRKHLRGLLKRHGLAD